MKKLLLLFIACTTIVACQKEETAEPVLNEFGIDTEYEAKQIQAAQKRFNDYIADNPFETSASGKSSSGKIIKHISNGSDYRYTRWDIQVWLNGLGLHYGNNKNDEGIDRDTWIDKPAALFYNTKTKVRLVLIYDPDTNITSFVWSAKDRSLSPGSWTYYEDKLNIYQVEIFWQEAVDNLVPAILADDNEIPDPEGEIPDSDLVSNFPSLSYFVNEILLDDNIIEKENFAIVRSLEEMIDVDGQKNLNIYLPEYNKIMVWVDYHHGMYSEYDLDTNEFQEFNMFYSANTEVFNSDGTWSHTIYGQPSPWLDGAVDVFGLQPGYWLDYAYRHLSGTTEESWSEWLYSHSASAATCEHDFRTIADFIAWAKENPETVYYDIGYGVAIYTCEGVIGVEDYDGSPDNPTTFNLCEGFINDSEVNPVGYWFDISGWNVEFPTVEIYIITGDNWPGDEVIFTPGGYDDPCDSLKDEYIDQG